MEQSVKAHGSYPTNAIMDITENMPVYSVLVYLLKEEDESEDSFVGSPYVREVAGMGHHFSFQVIKMWEVPPEVAKQPGYEVLLPLLPLTKGGQNLQTVDDMITELIARNRPDLLGLGQFCAGLVFTDEVSKQWLTERFDKVLNIFEESWTYQQTLQKGREEGRQEGIQAAQQTAISIVARRFPELELLARAIITMISDLNQLQMLTVELSIASSQERIKELLMSFVSAA